MDTLTNIGQSLITKKYSWVILIVSLLAFYLAYNYFTELFAPINGLLCASIWFVLVNFIDDKAFKGVNTYEEIIVKRNIAYALYFLGICIGTVVAFALGILIVIGIK